MQLRCNADIELPFKWSLREFPASGTFFQVAVDCSNERMLQVWNGQCRVGDDVVNEENVSFETAVTY